MSESFFGRSSWFVALCVVGIALTAKLMSEGASDVSPTPNSTQQTGPTTPYAAIAKGRIDVEGGIIQLAASRDGIITEVFVEEGDLVKKGQVLAAQDDRHARLNLELQRAEVAHARTALPVLQVRLAAAEREQVRLSRAIQDQATSQQEVDRAEDSLRQLRAEIGQAEEHLKVAQARQRVAEYEVDRRVIRAPLDGRIVRRLARPGDGVSTLNVTPLFWFVPDTTRIVRAELEERFIEAVRPGMVAEVVPEADEKHTYTGRVLRVGLVFGPKRPRTDDPQERVDERVVECVVSLDHQHLVLGQRVLVKFK